MDIGDLGRMLGSADDAALSKVRAIVREYMPDAADDVENLIQMEHFLLHHRSGYVLVVYSRRSGGCRGWISLTTNRRDWLSASRLSY